METTAKKPWKQMWKHHLQEKYSETADRWNAEWDKETPEDMTDNSKVVFCLCYQQMQEALNSLPDEPQILVRSAVTSRFEQMQQTMDEILEVFAKA